jgi:hypothetical protein
MNEHSDDLDLAACTRRARRWGIGLVCLLAINGCLVTLALGGFGAAPRRQPAAGSSDSVAQVAAPQPTTRQPPATTPQPQPGVVTPQVAAPQADDPPIVARIADPALEFPWDSVPGDVTGLEPPTLAWDAVPPAMPVAPSPPSLPQPIAPPPPSSSSLVILNPPTTGGEVYFAIDGLVFRLAPGEYQEFAGTAERRVEYHRGGDFGNQAHTLQSGNHAFGVESTGWLLQPVDPAAARDLLRTCRTAGGPAD